MGRRIERLEQSVDGNVGKQAPRDGAQRVASWRSRFTNLFDDLLHVVSLERVLGNNVVQGRFQAVWGVKGLMLCFKREDKGSEECSIGWRVRKDVGDAAENDKPSLTCICGEGLVLDEGTKPISSRTAVMASRSFSNAPWATPDLTVCTFERRVGMEHERGWGHRRAL